jgi:hypothetical protein
MVHTPYFLDRKKEILPRESRSVFHYFMYISPSHCSYIVNMSRGTPVSLMKAIQLRGDMRGVNPWSGRGRATP